MYYERIFVFVTCKVIITSEEKYLPKIIKAPENKSFQGLCFFIIPDRERDKLHSCRRTSS